MGLREAYLPLLLSLTLFIFIRARRKFGSDFFIAFSFYLFMNLLVEFISGIQFHYHRSNMLLYNAAVLIEGLTFCYMFYSFHKNRTIKQLLLFSSIFFAVFWAVNILFVQKNDRFDTYSYLFSCTILSVYSLLTIYAIVFDDIVANPFYCFFFWASIGILFCYLGNIPFLLSYDILVVKQTILAYSLSFISQVVNSILYVMIIVGTLFHRSEHA